MKVVIVCGAGYVSGKEIISLQLLQGLQANGFEVACIMSNWSNGDFEKRLKHAGISTYKVRIGFISKTLDWSAIRMTIVQLWYTPYLLISYSKLLRKLKPDVVIHTNFHHLFTLLPVLGTARQVYWSHEIISNSGFYKWLFSRFASVIDVFVGVSEAVSDSLKRIIATRPVITVRNGSAMPSVESNHKNEAIDPTKRNFAIVGQVAPHKGHVLLFEALGRLHASKNKFLLHIIGTGEKEFISHLKQRADELKISDLIRWRGFVSNVEEIYSGIDCVIVPTVRPEPLGLIIMEAGLRGIPSIGSDTGGIPELITDSHNGFLFRTGDAEDLAQKIELMSESELDDYKRISRSHAVTHFSDKLFLKEYAQLIQDLCRY